MASNGPTALPLTRVSSAGEVAAEPSPSEPAAGEPDADDGQSEIGAAISVLATAKAVYISLRLCKPQNAKADYWDFIGLYGDHKDRKQNRQPDAHCTLCRKDLSYGGSGNLEKHFKNQHKELITAGPTMPNFMVDKRKFHWLSLRWIVLTYQSIRVVESEAFKAMIRSANQNIRIPNRQDVVDGLDQLENLARAGIIDLVAGNYPALTTDGWSSATGEGYVCVTLDMIDTKWNKLHLPLECSPMKGSHTAERLLEKVRPSSV